MDDLKQFIADLESYDEGCPPADGWWVAYTDLQRAADVIARLQSQLNKYRWTPEAYEVLMDRVKELESDNASLTLRLDNLQSVSEKYLAHSDSGVYRDPAGLRPGASPQAEDLRAALESAVDRQFTYIDQDEFSKKLKASAPDRQCSICGRSAQPGDLLCKQCIVNGKIPPTEEVTVDLKSANKLEFEPSLYDESAPDSLCRHGKLPGELCAECEKTADRLVKEATANKEPFVKGGPYHGRNHPWIK